MTEFDVDIRPFDLKGATSAEYEAISRHYNNLRAETLPDDPPMPVDERIADLQNIPSFVECQIWAAWNSQGEIVATGGASCLNTPENEHLLFFDIDVDQRYRGHGIGTHMLKLAAQVAVDKQRRMMMADTNERIPAGEDFMRRMGASRGLDNHTNQLVLAELNRNLLKDWLEVAPTKAPGFTLGYWEDAYPDDAIESVCRLMDILNDAPRGDLQMNDWKTTPTQLREGEARMTAKGTERWTIYALDGELGQFAGVSEIYWNKNRPELVNQGITGVFPEFRGKGLGRWMKAAMLDRVVRERPNVKYVRTGNADSNKPMLEINTALGFKPYISRCVWQIETEKAAEFLGLK